MFQVGVLGLGGVVTVWEVLHDSVCRATHAGGQQGHRVHLLRHPGWQQTVSRAQERLLEATTPGVGQPLPHRMS